MEMRQLKTFFTAAELGSFTRAAHALGYVQSSVTAQIQALEAELGAALFDRLGKQVKLTAAGERLARYAEQILALTEEARLSVVSGEQLAGTLVFSAPETLCTYRLPTVLQRFRARYPQVRLLFQPGPVGDLRRRVSDGTLDLAFILEEPLPPGVLVAEPLVTEPVLILAAPDHPLAGLPAVGPGHFRGETMLYTERGCAYRRQFERALAVCGAEPAATLEFQSVEAIKQCALLGMGVTVLPAVAVAAEVSQGRLVALPWSGGPLQILTQMITHRDRSESPAMRVFRQVVCEMVQEGHYRTSR